MIILVLKEKKLVRYASEQDRYSDDFLILVIGKDSSYLLKPLMT